MVKKKDCGRGVSNISFNQCFVLHVHCSVLYKKLVNKQTLQIMNYKDINYRKSCRLDIEIQRIK